MFDLAQRARPVLKWAGGKSSLLPQFLKVFPTSCDRYIEPFLGSGAVCFALQPGVPAILNDSNDELINLYTVLASEPKLLMARLDAMAAEYSEETYYQVRAQEPKEPVQRAARTVFLNKTGFNGLYRQNAKGTFNVPFGRRATCPRLYDHGNLLKVSQRLGEAKLVNQDFETILELAQRGDFVYCDPPYEPLTATSSFKNYTGSGFSQEDQRRLKEACVRAARRGAVVAVSNSSAPFVKELYADWPIHSITARRSINSKKDLRGAVEEILVIMC